MKHWVLCRWQRLKPACYKKNKHVELTCSKILEPFQEFHEFIDPSNDLLLVMNLDRQHLGRPIEEQRKFRGEQLLFGILLTYQVSNFVFWNTLTADLIWNFLRRRHRWRYRENSYLQLYTKSCVRYVSCKLKMCS